MEEDDVLGKYQHSFDQMKGKIHVLERQVPLDKQMEYFKESRKWRLCMQGIIPATNEDCNAWYDLLIDDEVIKTEEDIKNLLLNLANSKSPLAYRLLKQYISKDLDENIMDWAHLALLELEINLESDFSNEKQIYISTGLGGKGSKLRFYIIFVSADRKPFEEYQRNVIEREFSYYFPQKDCEIESLNVFSNYAELLLLIPIGANIKKILHDIINECNEYGHFIAKKYTITNVKKPTDEEIQEILNKKNDDEDDVDIIQ